ncbi:MAG: asparagine synthase (glutamine-hydrolyzing) [Lachnospiraceae bacterium]|nr:asparagine synthase (glutamine-hydrolyzing) [Lachnospiraceae bacterium]
MCGICGYITKNEYNDQMLREMNDTMYHRGPNDSGCYQTNLSAGYQLGLAHRRLSILDLSALGHQPMFNEDNRISIVYNGEVYNYLELREELLKKGYHFKSNCDTEVILTAYEAYGMEFLQKLNGMFALAIYDSREEKVILARDRMGKKPLYYYTDHQGNLIFGSELKPLMKHPDFKKEIRTEIISRYLCYKYINAPDTIFQDTHKVMPGECIVWENGTIEKSLYWDILKRYQACSEHPIKEYQEAKEQLHNLLQDSVERRLMADVSVGTFLSGGIDSTLITALAQRVVKEPVKTFTIGFETKKENEAVYAKEIANYIGTDHTELYITEKELFEVIKDLPKYYDEPFADSSQIPTMLVSKLAKQGATVILSGDGGDELFCGYTLYDWTYWAQRLDGVAGIANGVLGAFGMNDHLPDKMRALLHNRDKNTKVQLFTDIRENHTVDMIRGDSLTAKYRREQNIQEKDWQIKRQLLDMMTDLPGDMLAKVDRGAMKYSLEVRCPILDYRVAELSFQMPQQFKYHKGDKKHILKDITFDMVPKSLLDRPKQGFGVPLALWLRTKLYKQMVRYADPKILDRQGIFNADKIHEFIVCLEHSDTSLYNSVLWAFYVFQMWYQEYVEDLWNS